MRYSILVTSVALAIVPAVQGQVIGFEDVNVPTPPGYVNGSGGAGGTTTFTSGGATFNNFYDTSFGNWAGWSVSRVNDVTTQGFGNQYAAYNLPNGVGDNSPEGTLPWNSIFCWPNTEEMQSTAKPAHRILTWIPNSVTWIRLNGS